MVKVYIEGMMCGHCAKRVEDALFKLGLNANVDLKEKCAVIADGQAPADDKMKRAVADAGYEVTRIERAD